MDQTVIHTKDPLELESILDSYGVAVLEDYFETNFADKLFNSTKKWLIELDIGLTNDVNSWVNHNMPLGPRYGMYQSIVSHSPGFWELREKMHEIFSYLVGTDKLLTSIDGASIYPSQNKPNPKRVHDWAHIDQTISSDHLCYQSQFVTTDTTASFVATIGSHLKHAKILEICDMTGNSSNWYKFTEEDIIKLKKMFGANYQTPIHSKKGSIIFWDSRTIHSAKYQDEDDNTWRGAFYVSMRSVDQFNNRNINTISRAAIEGRTTNHWCTKLFGTSDRYGTKNNKIKNLLKNLEKISYVHHMTDLQKKISGLLNY